MLCLVTYGSANSELAHTKNVCQLKIRASCCCHICEGLTSTTIRNNVVFYTRTIIRGDRIPREYQFIFLGIGKVNAVRSSKDWEKLEMHDMQYY